MRMLERGKFTAQKFAATFAASAVIANCAGATTISTTWYNDNKSSFKNSNLSGSFAFRSNQLVEDVGEVVGNQYYSDFELNYRNKTSDGVDKVFQAAARLNDEDQLMFSIPEAKVSYTFGANQLVFGRTILDWSELDHAWGFGKINNRKNFDGFEPGHEGLTGFTFNRHNDNGFKFSLFTSVIYVPEMNPGLKINKDDGTVECQNPWCKAPSAEAPISDDVTVPIYYNVNYPEITDVVFRYSAGLRIGYDKDLLAIEAYGIRKPENQLSTTVEIKYEVDNSRVFADITPQVYYHDVVGGDLKIRPNDNFTIYGSVMGVYPSKYPDGDEPYIEYTGIKPEKKKEEYAGGGVAFHHDWISTGINYIARISKYDRENDLLAEYPRWNQAYHIYASTLLFSKLSLGIDFKYDMLTEDRLAMYNASYQASKDLKLALGVNVIGSGAGDSYWSDFTNNDSVYGSLAYKF